MKSLKKLRADIFYNLLYKITSQEKESLEGKRKESLEEKGLIKRIFKYKR